MLDPITALGVAGNVCQFVDFGLKVTSKAIEIHKSIDGALSENIDIETWAEDLTQVATKLESSSATPTGSDSLDDICKRCTAAAIELLTALKSVKLQGNKTKVKSTWTAIKATWKKKSIEEMKKRMEGFRDEMQIHVLASLKCCIDIEFAKQSERLEGLDEHGKVVLERLASNHDIIIGAITVGGNHTTATIISNQDETRAEIVTTIATQGRAVIETVTEQKISVEDALRQESVKSDERHQSTTNQIVTELEETHAQVITTLDRLDARSQAEHEVTRNELEQLKIAMAQIEQQMIRRDEELRALIVARGQVHSKKERRKLQEKSNAVTVAICALVTIYQSLEKMVLALQAHAKVLVTTSSIQHLFTKAGQRTDNGSGNSIKDFLAAITSQPSSFWSPPTPAVIENFLDDFNLERQEYWKRLERIRDIPFSGTITVDYDTIQKDPRVQKFFANAPGVLESLRRAQGTAPIGSTIGSKWREAVLQKQFAAVGEAAHIAEKNACDIDIWILSYVLGNSWEANLYSASTDQRDESLHNLRSITIISAILVEYIGIQGASNLLKHVFNSRTLPHIVAMSTVGRVAGVQETAKQMVTSRAQKWGVEKDDSKTFNTSTTFIRDFLQWFFHKPHEHYFTISIGSGTERAAGILVYAFVECLVHFGFLLALPAIVVHKNKLFAEVQRISRTPSNDGVSDSNHTGTLNRILLGVKPADQGWELQRILEKEILNDMLGACILGDDAEIRSLETIAQSTASQIIMSGDIPPKLVKLMGSVHGGYQSGEAASSDATGSEASRSLYEHPVSDVRLSAMREINDLFTGQSAEAESSQVSAYLY